MSRPRKRKTAAPSPTSSPTCVSCGDTLRCPTCWPGRADDLTPSELIDTVETALSTLTAWELVDLRRLVAEEIDRRGSAACAGFGSIRSLEITGTPAP